MKLYTIEQIEALEKFIQDNLVDGSENLYKFTVRLPMKKNDMIICGFINGNSPIHAIDKFKTFTGLNVGGWKLLEIHNPSDNKVISKHLGF